MSARLEGRVALVTGAARGQGRSHAVAFAAAGADVVVVDVCRQIETVTYPMATPEDLAETVRLVEQHDRRAVALQIDVREAAALEAEVAGAVGELGRLDVVVANAGIAPVGRDLPPKTYTDTLGVVFGGVVNTIGAALPHLTDGGSIIVTGSTAGLRASSGSGVSALGMGGSAYAVGKKALVPLVRDLAYELGPHRIRVNGVHPSNCNTTLLHNDGMYRAFRPDLAEPTREDAEVTFPRMHRLPVGYVEPADITAVVLLLASDDGRYITGQNIAVDAGALLSTV